MDLHSLFAARQGRPSFLNFLLVFFPHHLFSLFTDRSIDYISLSGSLHQLQAFLHFIAFVWIRQSHYVSIVLYGWVVPTMCEHVRSEEAPSGPKCRMEGEREAYRLFVCRVILVSQTDRLSARLPVWRILYFRYDVFFTPIRQSRCLPLGNQPVRNDVIQLTGADTLSRRLETEEVRNPCEQDENGVCDWCYPGVHLAVSADWFQRHRLLISRFCV
jgi:hypothetical protein